MAYYSGNDGDYISRIRSMESQCAIYEQQAEDEYRSKGRHTKQECIYLQQAADLRQEMATISTGGVQEYQQRKKRELDMRIREIVGILNPELLRRFDAGQVKKGGSAKAGTKAGTGAASGAGGTAAAAKGKDSDIDVSKWFKEIPLHTFDDVAGMDDLKEKLRQCVVDTRVGKLKEYLGIPRLHSFFFIGPPGCGKTYIVEAFAHELMEQNYKYRRCLQEQIPAQPSRARRDADNRLPGGLQPHQRAQGSQDHHFHRCDKLSRQSRQCHDGPR